MEQLLVKNIGTLIVDKHCKELCWRESSQLFYHYSDEERQLPALRLYVTCHQACVPCRERMSCMIKTNRMIMIL